MSTDQGKPTLPNMLLELAASLGCDLHYGGAPPKCPSEGWRCPQCKAAEAMRLAAKEIENLSGGPERKTWGKSSLW